MALFWFRYDYEEAQVSWVSAFKVTDIIDIPIRTRTWILGSGNRSVISVVPYYQGVYREVG